MAKITLQPEIKYLSEKSGVSHMYLDIFSDKGEHLSSVMWIPREVNKLDAGIKLNDKQA